jgi:hypothetical protein
VPPVPAAPALQLHCQPHPLIRVAGRVLEPAQRRPQVIVFAFESCDPIQHMPIAPFWNRHLSQRQEVRRVLLMVDRWTLRRERDLRHNPSGGQPDR